jgi:membrane-bound metal-dependent hydrolase YbcI (DUF457 family)
MFIGHFALGFAAKRAVPRVSLGMLFAAAQLADLLWPLFLALGIEQVRIDPESGNPFTLLDFVSYPYSHSLLMLVVWGVVLGGLYRAIAGGRRTFVVLAALVVSHWLLDFVTHRPDMPLYPGSAVVGLGLWKSVPATIAVELPLFLVGVFVYVRATRSRDAVGKWALYGLVALLLAAYAGSIVGGAPPSFTALWTTALGGFILLFALAWWVDRHRIQY